MKNKKKYLYSTLALLIVLTLFVIIKPNNEKEVKVINEKKEQKSFAIYKDDGSGNYTISSDTTFPTKGYILNMDKTKCFDSNNTNVSNNIVSQSLDGKITLSATVSTYCELYFTKDSAAPTVTSFSITGLDSGNNVLNNGYSYSSNVTYKIGWSDTDVTHYCLTTNATSCDKTWIETGGVQSINVSNSTFTETEGSHTIYVYLKDKAQNVSSTTATSTKTIIVDRTKPVVKTFTLTGTAESGQELSNSTNYTHKANITYNATIEESNIDQYCIYESSCSYVTTTSTSFSKVSFNLTNSEGSHSVKIRVKDKAGNESEINTTSTKNITLDKTNPTATISKNTQDTSSITVTVSYSGTDTIIARQCRISNGSWQDASNTNGSCKISNLSDGQTYTIQGRVRDASGRWNTTYPSVSVTTDKKIITGSDLLTNPPAGLTETDCNGMKRFVGQCNAVDGSCDDLVNNFVCFGYNNESDCYGDLNTNDYIYRIIGIESDGKIKLLKNRPVASLPWHNNYREDITWSESDLFKSVNGSIFYDKLDDKWKSKIIKHPWSNGGIVDEDQEGNDEFLNITSKEMCVLESGLPTVEAKVGLISISDYYYSGNGVNSVCPFYINEKYNYSCTRNWMSLYMCLDPINDGLGRDDWTIVREIEPGQDMFRSVYIYTTSTIAGATPVWLNTKNSVRPVFYLDTTSNIKDGTGTSKKPFIIAK